MTAVAVLMSVYKADKPAMLERALLSILEQQLDVEVRIYLGVDGPIPASLADVISLYEKRLYRLLHFSTNRGLVHVLNDLIHQTEDEALLFRMDADDWSRPQRFAKQIAYMQASPHVDILGTAIIEVDIASGNRRIIRFASTPEAARRDIAKRVPIAHPTACFRRHVFERLGGYPPVRFNEDIALWFECIRAGLVFDNIDEPLYEFTIDENFWCRRSFEKAWSEFLTYCRGLWRLSGISWRYIYPVARLCLRLSPRGLQKIAYASDLRKARPATADNL